MTECPLRRGVRLREVKNAVLVSGWDRDLVSAYERCLLRRGIHL